MQKLPCGFAALLLAALLVGGAPYAHAASKATAPAAALAYVTNNQVAVIEAGNLTVAGPGQNPVWSPTGAHLLFDVPDMLGNNATIYVADTHGANAKAIVTHAYPGINPSWSADGNYVLYTVTVPHTTAVTPTTRSTKKQTVQLQVQALQLSNGSTKTLGKFTFAAGCPITSSALMASFATAQGSYQGVPSTLIWAQPNLVLVQSSCTGQGLTLFNVGGRNVKTLPNWSAAVLSPDRKSVAAEVAGSKGGNGQVGVITVSSRATKVLAPRLAPAGIAWWSNSKVLFVASEPSKPATGTATLYRVTSDGKIVETVGKLQAAGIFHLSLNATADHLSLSVVANAPVNAPAPPATTVYDADALYSNVAPTPLVPGSQASWRPAAH